MASPLTLPQSPELYLPFYRGELVGIGASGKEVEGGQGRQLLASIQRCVQDGIRVLIAYGGGGPINALYRERYHADRPRKGGYACTDERVLGCAIDVHDQIEAALLGGLRDVLPEIPVDVIPPEAVICTYRDQENLGYVGDPLRIDHDIVAPVTVVGFNGFVGKQRVNVNKDDTMAQLAPWTVENFLVTPSGGIYTEYDPRAPDPRKLIPVLFARDITPEGRHPDVSDEDGTLLPKLRNAREMSADARTVITSGANIPAELYSVGGEGTLVIDSDKIIADHPTAKELAVVRYVIEQYEKAGIFRVRTEQEKRLALRHHLILREHTPLAGCSLIPYEDGSMELGTWWSGYNGMGRILAQNAKAQFLRHPFCHTLFALSMPEDPANDSITDPALQRFLQNGFRCQGRLSETQQKRSTPAHLRGYDTAARNPYLFTIARRDLLRVS